MPLQHVSAFNQRVNDVTPLILELCTADHFCFAVLVLDVPIVIVFMASNDEEKVYCSSVYNFEKYCIIEARRCPSM